MLKAKKKGARTRTRSILFGEDNTRHLEDRQGPTSKTTNSHLFCCETYRVKNTVMWDSSGYTLGILLGENS